MCGISGAFEKLPDSRKEQILQVCMEEFVQNGYRNASTNTMVKRLGISKGVLFLYFKNKKNLYLYLMKYLTEDLVNKYFGQYGGEPAISIDIFDNLGEYYRALLQEKPEMVLFMLDAFLNAPAEIRDEVEAVHNESHSNVFHYLNNAGFREGIDTEMVINLLHMVSYHVGHLIFEEYKKDEGISPANSEDIRKRINYFEALFLKYIDILKYGVYAR